MSKDKIKKKKKKKDSASKAKVQSNVVQEITNELVNMTEEQLLTKKKSMELKAEEAAKMRMLHSEAFIEKAIRVDFNKGQLKINRDWMMQHLCYRLEDEAGSPKEPQIRELYDFMRNTLGNYCNYDYNVYNITLEQLTHDWAKVFRDYVIKLDHMKDTFLLKAYGLSKEELLNIEIRELGDFMIAYALLSDNKGRFSFGVTFNERIYNLEFKCNIHESFGQPPFLLLSAACQICDKTESIIHHIALSKIESGHYTFHSFIEKYFPLVQPATKEVSMSALHERCEEWRDQCGTQIMVKSAALLEVNSFFNTRLVPTSYGTKESPKRAIVEFELEVEEEDRRYSNNKNDNMQVLPYVRFFAGDYKKYLYVDVRDIEVYDYDPKALNNLILPPETKKFISKLFDADINSAFSDIIRGKHGGLIICTSGPTGVGKTLTAETFGEVKSMPLYPLDMAELGTDVVSVENALQVIFERVTRWNALLLFDEADVFLSKRGDNIEKSAIVSVFLRLLDYFKGIMFITTNRLDVLDPAVLSRVTVQLDFPQLDNSTRIMIWKKILGAAKITLKDPKNLIKVAEVPANGRQIRNMIRVIKMVHTGKSRITCAELTDVMKYSTAELTENISK